MYGILSILGIVLIYYSANIIPDKIKEWWDNSKIKEWSYPTFVVVLTLAVALGIRYGVLKWITIFFPILFGFPYILGAIVGIWNNMKNAGKKITVSLHPSCPDNHYFIASVLHSFFETKENVRAMFQNLKTQQKDFQKYCHFAGFTAN